MIKCPNCQHQENVGTIFCSQCGTKLPPVKETKTRKIVTAENLMNLQDTATPFPQIPSDPISSVISLHMVESGQILPLADRVEFTIGRLSEGQPIVPDVDLTPYNAYSNGVSRLHAVIKTINDRPNIMDLGSSNGTYLNGIQLKPNMEAPLTHGDVVALGKLKIQVLLNLPKK